MIYHNCDGPDSYVCDDCYLRVKSEKVPDGWRVNDHLCCHQCSRRTPLLDDNEFEQGLKAIEEALEEMAGHSHFNADGRFSRGIWAYRVLLKRPGR